MRADGRQWASFMLLIIEVRGQEAGVRPISCGWASGGAAIFKQAPELLTVGPNSGDRAHPDWFTAARMWGRTRPSDTCSKKSGDGHHKGGHNSKSWFCNGISHLSSDCQTASRRTVKFLFIKDSML